MSTHAETIIKHFRALDRALQSCGWVATSPWWHEKVAEFYRSAATQFVLRVGRRGGKSSTLCRLAVCEALYGQHNVPHGDVGTVAIISQNKVEANKRLKTIKKILDTLGVEYHPIANGIELDDRPIAFEVFAATIQGVSGFTGIMVICDETSKWKDADTGVNPASEVLASVRPTMSTMPEARILLSSSPFGRFDAHYDAFERGSDAFQLCAHAASWTANPTLTEERTHELEPDRSLWKREYAAIPSDDVLEAIVTSEELERISRKDGESIAYQAGHEYHASMDPATRTNAWTLAIACMRMCEGVDSDGQPTRKMKRSVVHAQEWRGRPGEPLRPKAILGHIADVMRRYGIDTLWSDQWSGDAMRDIADGLGITLIVETATGPSNREMYKNLATYIRTDLIELPALKHVKQDLLGVRKRITRSGETIELQTTPDGRHSDYAPPIARVMSKPMSEPRPEDAEEGSPEWLLEQKKKRYDAFEAERNRPYWQAKGGAADRGERAFWRRDR